MLWPGAGLQLFLVPASKRFYPSPLNPRPRSAPTVMAATLFYPGAPRKLQPYFYFGDRYIILPVLLRAITTFCFKKSHSLRICSFAAIFVM